MKDYIWQRLGNPVERALVRTGLARVLHDLLDAREGAPRHDAAALAQALAYAERYALTAARQPRVLIDANGVRALDAPALAQLFVDPAYGALAACYEAWHRESAPRMIEELKRAEHLAA